jgi:hypothetical protein
LPGCHDQKIPGDEAVRVTREHAPQMLLGYGGAAELELNSAGEELARRVVRHDL